MITEATVIIDNSNWMRAAEKANLAMTSPTGNVKVLPSGGALYH